MALIRETELIQPLLQYNLFFDYAKTVKEMLQKMIYLERFPRENNVAIFYTTPKKAWSLYVKKLVNGEYLAPIITYYLSGMDNPIEQTMGAFNGIWDIDKNDSNHHMFFLTPIIYKLTYNITIWTTTQTDMDNILSQFLIYTKQPKVYTTKVKDAWCLIETENITIEDELEPGESKDKTIRRGVTISIPRAYLPRECYHLYTQPIKEIDFHDITSLKLNNLTSDEILALNTDSTTNNEIIENYAS
jgi:hypothetical protein